MKKKLLLLLLMLTVSIFAEEGMWLLNQLDQLDLEEQGLQIKVDDIYHPRKTSITDAIVWLGGCSSSFVSPDGLLLTNHHCAFGALQRASTKCNDYLKNGFLARKRSDEIQAKGTNAYVLQEMKDVTQKVLKAAKDIEDPVAKNKKITAKITEMTENIEGDREDIHAIIKSMYKGKQYLLFVYKKYQDVRIVYAPPKSIGKYGGDVDNWMWPRHTGDFTFMRVYQAPDGSGAKYSEDNIPVKPKNYLRVAKEPLRKGDFTFILGFPGSTKRWRTSHSVDWNLNYYYPRAIKNFSEMLDLMGQLTKHSEEAKMKVASLDAGLNNAMKNYQGNLDCMKKSNFLDEKITFEKELMNYLNTNENLKKKYGDVLENIGALYQERTKTRDKDYILGMFEFSGGTLTRLANKIYDIAKERSKPKEERDPDFSEKDVKLTLDRLHLRYYRYYEPVDKAFLQRLLRKADNLPEGSRISGLEYVLNNKDISDFVEKAYAKTKLDSLAYARSLFDKSVKELEALDDPLVQMAVSIYDEQEAREDREEAFHAKIKSYRKKYLEALSKWDRNGIYPDANSTIRFTYGHIAGYEPADAVWYEPFTTLSGVIEKNTGEEPFNNPEKLQQLYKNKDYGRWMDRELNDVPVNFLHRCDITGGNSGSAVMNARGELIGLAFDGNYEALTSDWQYNYEMQRTISVDIRYILYITEKFAGADYLLEEMGVN